MGEFSKFIEWGFMAMLTGCVGWAAVFLTKISASISELNVQIATIIERTSHHQFEIEKHDERISRLEARKFRQ